MVTEDDSSTLRIPHSSQTSFDPSAQQRWSEREIVHLIEAYQEKWYQLKRGQLKARHWEEVANNVFLRCGGTEPSKSSVQCRHKMEKLRKKYREDKQLEEQRGRGASNWAYFERLDVMERGLASSSKPVYAGRNAHPSLNLQDRDLQDRESAMSLNDDLQDATPPRTFHPSLPKMTIAGASYSSLNRISHPIHHGKEDGSLKLENRMMLSAEERACLKRRKMLAEAPIAELASVVRSLGEGFLKIEQLKLEMQRDNERLRAEVELKRTGMLLDSQKQIAEMFSKVLRKKKSVKKRQIHEI